MTKARKQFIGIQRISDNSSASSKFISMGPRRLMKTKTFQKKPILPMERHLGQSFLVISTLTNLRELFVRVHEVF